MMVIGENLKGKSVLVTGATGFVGSHLTRRLLGLGAEVTIFSRASSSEKLLGEYRQLGAKIVLGDLADPLAVQAVCKGQEVIFHVGALYREAKFPDKVYFDVNLEGTRNVLEGALKHKVKRVVHTSTTGVHSHIANPPAKEDEPYHPTDVYQISKTEAEKLARSYFESGKLNGVILRPGMIYGEGDTRFLKLFKGIARGRFPLIGDGRTWTHWIYISDLVDAYLLAAERPQAVGKIYFIAGKRPLRMAEVFETIASIAGVKTFPFRVPVWPILLAGAIVEGICKPFGIEPPLHRRRVAFFVKNRSFDITAARNDLGFEPRLDFEDEARRIFNWYKENGWL